MKSYFIRLFNYDLFANRQINGLIQRSATNEKPTRLMAHLLAAGQVWLKRCQGMSTAGAVIWPDWKADEFEGIITDNHHNWINFINVLQEKDLENVIRYKNIAGEGFQDILCDIMAHVINHSTHTRAQAGQHLKQNENDHLPVTDYSYYLRQINK